MAGQYRHSFIHYEQRIHRRGYVNKNPAEVILADGAYKS